MSRNARVTVLPLRERERPGLSVTLPYERRPDTCQACGVLFDIRLWEECDPWDQPQKPPVVVVLCNACGLRLIEPHARLYRPLELFAPLPGVMALCADCCNREGLRCRSPLLKANGGSGLAITFSKPTEAMVCYGGGRGDFVRLYEKPPSKCAGREAVGDEPVQSGYSGA